MSSMLLTSCKGPSDSDIQKSVNEKIASNAGLSATVTDGVVTLTGECADENCKTSSEAAVKGVKGVKSVSNNITIAAAPAPVVITADDPLKQGVDAALSNYNGVTADVNNGVVTLRGDIKRADLQKLMVSLNALRPKKIDNQLSVK
jgi:osmotically-inducible protein OsmY